MESGHMRSFRAILLIAAPFCLAMGLVLPLVRFDRLYFFSDTPSLLAIIGSLWQSGNGLLAGVVSLVSIGLPALKLVSLAVEAMGKGSGGAFFERILPQLSRWAMMDVLLVAIVIAAAKSSGLGSAFTQAGLWFYASSTIISGLLHVLLRTGSGPKG
jgi:paraquat-inducible protein A